MTQYLNIPQVIVIQKAPDEFEIVDVRGSKLSLDFEGLATFLACEGSFDISRISSELESKGIRVSQNEISSNVERLVAKDILLKNKYRFDPLFDREQVLKLAQTQFKKERALSLSLLALACTSFCPYSCKLCYRKPMDKNAKQIPIKYYKQSISDAKKLGALSICISGGEPTCDQGIKRAISLAEYAKKEGFKNITLITAGYNLPEHLDTLIEKGVNNIHISLDGFKQYHNEYRGHPQAYSRAITAIRACIGRKVKFKVGAVLTMKNYAGLNSFTQMLAALGVSNISFLKPITYPYNKEVESMQINPTVSKNIMHNIKELEKQYPTTKLRYSLKDLMKEDYLNCEAGITYAHITEFGEVLPCAFLSYDPAGTIIQQRFIDIWESSQVFKKYRTLKTFPEKCKACKKRKYCYTNCWAMYNPFPKDRSGEIICPSK